MNIHSNAELYFPPFLTKLQQKRSKKNIGFSQKNENPFFWPKNNQYFGRNNESNSPNMECHTLLNS